MINSLIIIVLILVVDLVIPIMIRYYGLQITVNKRMGRICDKINRVVLLIPFLLLLINVSDEMWNTTMIILIINSLISNVYRANKENDDDNDFNDSVEEEEKEYPLNLIHPIK